MKKVKYLLGIIAVILAMCMFATACDKTGENGGGGGDKGETTHIVTFVYNDDITPNATQQVKEGEKAVEPTAPVKEGHAFLGWFNGETKFVFTTSITESITLNAKWEKTSVEEQSYAISYAKLEGAEFVFDNIVPIEKAKAGETVRFKVDVSPYYAGTLAVTAANVALTPDANKYYSFVVAGDTSVVISGITLDSTPMPGKGTQTDPYIISSAYQLKFFTDKVNQGNANYAGNMQRAVYYELGADIDLKGSAISSIGNGEMLNGAQVSFWGDFDGKGHTVKNYRISSSGAAAGFFGIATLASVRNLNLEEFVINYSGKLDAATVGGVVSYALGSEIINCKATGSIIGNIGSSSSLVYAGGIAGFSQGYRGGYSGIIYYCSSDVEIKTTANSFFSAGGIVGTIIGTSTLEPSVVSNSAAKGDVNNAMLAGGVVGHMREYSSVNNSYAVGDVSAKNNGGLAAAGGICGMSENETIISASFATGIVSAQSATEAFKGDLVGRVYEDQYLSVTSKQTVIKNAYFGANGIIETETKDYDMMLGDDVKLLLNWKDTDWTFADGYPTVRADALANAAATITFNFSGEKVSTGAALESTQVFEMDTYLPLSWIYGNVGQNNFTAQSGKISYGYYFDAACTQRIPAAYVLSNDTTIYVGFADYTPTVGEFFLADKDGELARLTLDGNGKLTLSYDGKIVNYVYTFDGENILIKDSYLVKMFAQSPSLAVTDVLANIERGRLNILLKFTDTIDGVATEVEKRVRAYPNNDFVGTWYAPSGDEYRFEPNLNGYMLTKEGTQTVRKELQYTIDGNEVTVFDKDFSELFTATLSLDKTSLTGANGTELSATKFDEFYGVWEGNVAEGFKLSFDGKGGVTDGESSIGSYTISGDTVIFTDLDFTAKFNEDGLLEVTNTVTNVVTLFGKEHSMMGEWHDPIYDATLWLYGIGKDGIGKAKDSNGFDLTYNVVKEKLPSGFEYYTFYLYDRTSSMGFGTLHDYDPTLDFGGPILSFAIYWEASGSILDNFEGGVKDMYYGTWFTSDGFDITFDGEGFYDINEQVAGQHWLQQGDATINGEKVRYTLDFVTKKGSFTYSGVKYLIEYDFHTQQVVVSPEGGNEKTYVQPDSYYTTVFEDEQGNLYTFNGKGMFAGQGEMTVTNITGETKFGYALSANGEVTLTQNGEAAGSITLNSESLFFEMKDASGNAINLGLYSFLTGDWIGSNNVSVGLFSAAGVANGTLNGEDVQFLYISDVLTQIYSDGGFLGYGVMVQYRDLYYAAFVDDVSYGIAAKDLHSAQDELIGVWSAANGDTIEFSGLGYNPVYMAAVVFTNAETKEDTVYYYQIGEDGKVLIGTYNEMDIFTATMEVSFTAISGSTAYTSGSQTIYIKTL